MPAPTSSSTPTEATVNVANKTASSTPESGKDDIEPSVKSVTPSRHLAVTPPAGALAEGVITLLSTKPDAAQNLVKIGDGNSTYIETFYCVENHLYLNIGYNLTRPIAQLRPDLPAMQFGFMYGVISDLHANMNMRLTFDPETVRDSGYTETFVSYKIGQPISMISTRDMYDWSTHEIYVDWELLPKKLTAKQHQRWTSLAAQSHCLALSKANLYVTRMLSYYQESLRILWTTHRKPSSKAATNLESFYNQAKRLQVKNLYLLQSLVAQPPGQTGWYMCESQHESQPKGYVCRFHTDSSNNEGKQELRRITDLQKQVTLNSKTQQMMTITRYNVNDRWVQTEIWSKDTLKKLIQTVINVK
ncbi:uncharacterized protein MELLADRAFT_104548 [Melampsora larici-populina 98AG31]|uniref:Uncharacterized protein n=1 Tax=Melampsora larici-populina (strain 98AG31 / pathotype 3-4-7) TaxID=747676 RepID=F4RF25_MELLP|nr:uncharacterized protein MELLADRAFT_104548 [Melampsora larici-populina 98AG31]EGG09010.1 hypothetical protein MELLADRAFT_104548 [Melampsora larici-populina 98AG31]